MGVRYYDERYYLDVSNELERIYLLHAQEEWNYMYEKEANNYSQLINSYNLYIELYHMFILF